MDASLYTTDGVVGLRREQAYDELKRGLLLGDFPLHLRLGEEKLAALLGVSRTPVREALLRLSAEGLIGAHPEGGYRPIAPDVDEVHDLYEVRMALELQALRRPGELGRTHDLAALGMLRDEWRVLADKRPEPDPELSRSTKTSTCGWPRRLGTRRWPTCSGSSTSASGWSG